MLVLSQFLIRCFDLILSLLALVVLSPLFLVLVIVLRFSGEGEIFYRQLRIGRGGTEFLLLKFATMLKRSPSIGTRELTLINDPRVLPVGRFLRKTKLNELPQLWNVIVGDLSLIGPRPQTKCYYKLYRKEDRLAIAKVRPGLSGAGSIIFRDEEEIISAAQNPTRFDEQIIMPYKGEIENWYIKNQSLLLYFELIFGTIIVVFFSSASYRRNLLKRLPPPPEELSYTLGQ